MMTPTENGLKRKKNASIIVELVIINVCKYRRPGGDPGFLDRGFKFIKGGTIC